MNKTKLLVYTLTLQFICIIAEAQISHLEPPFWWAGMKNPDLQLMVHGKNISDTKVAINYDGVEVKSISLVENPDFMFIDLKLSPDVRPGNFEIQFKKDNEIIESYIYALKERMAGSCQREGFNSTDVLYLIMPDRFANGNPSNDVIKGMKEGLERNDPDGRHGGDIQGIIDHLDYVSEMGFTAIWLNPVLENDQPEASYHGYATTDFYEVDNRFGTNEDYRKLGELAKAKGIKLIMDMIFNHCGSEHWWMKDMPSQDWINFYPDFTLTNHRRTVNQDPHASDIDSRIFTDGWFVPTMPDLNMRNPFMANYLIQNSIWWIEYVGLSGIRMDTYPYPFKWAMAEWNKRVLKEYPGFNLVGEEWSENPAIVSYWQRGQTNSDGYQGELPGLMDFPLQNALSRALNEPEEWGSGLIRLYETLANDFLYPDPDNLVVFPDNHDMSRFFMQVGMNVDLLRLGIAYILTTRGIPQIFYGTEILMTHTEGNNHGYIRKDFPGGWEGDKINGFTGLGLSAQELEIQNYFKKLLNWRKNCPVIHSGKMTHFVPQNGVYVYFRYDDGSKVMVILNKNKNEQLLELERFREILRDSVKGTDVISGKEIELNDIILLPPLAPLILELDKP
jgi:glycosidase